MVEFNEAKNHLDYFLFMLILLFKCFFPFIKKPNRHRQEQSGKEGMTVPDTQSHLLPTAQTHTGFRVYGCTVLVYIIHYIYKTVVTLALNSPLHCKLYSTLFFRNVFVHITVIHSCTHTHYLIILKFKGTLWSFWPLVALRSNVLMSESPFYFKQACTWHNICARGSTRVTWYTFLLLVSWFSTDWPLVAVTCKEAKQA